MDIHFETTGCRLNQIESESAAKFFLDKGFTVSFSPYNAKSSLDNECKIVVINTCAVTQKAEQKDRRIIHLALEKCPQACIIVTGCYAQLSCEKINEISDRVACLKGQIKSRIIEICDIFDKFNIGKNNSFCAKDFAFELKNNLFKRKQEKNNTSENAFALSTDSFLAHSRSSIKIQDGCNNRCSYCTICLARGFSVSLDVEQVISRIKKLENAGQNEVVFTTVNIAQYRGKFKDTYLNFSSLLELCLNETKKIRFRISSLYPEIIDEKFCNIIKNPRVCSHFHLSVQSGSDFILGRMNRNYLSKDIENAVLMLRNAKQNPFIACDIITGFPGESEECFDETMELLKKCNFSSVHVFPFSPRPDTKAFNMKPKVSEKIRDERAKKIGLWQKNQKKGYIDSCKSKIFSAIVENVKNKNYASDKGYIHAVTENFLHCKVTVPENFVYPFQGSLVNVKIISPISDFENLQEEYDVLAELVI